MERGFLGSKVDVRLWLHVSLCLYFVFKYVATIVGSCRSDYIPHCFWCVPSDFAPTHISVVELNWIVLTRSCGDIDKISSVSVDCSPPSCFEIYERDIALSSFFYGIWREGPAFSSRNARHNESLVLMLRYHGTLALT